MALTVSDIYQLLPKELTSCPHHRPVAESKFCAPLRATTAMLLQLVESARNGGQLPQQVIIDLGANNGKWSVAMLRAINNTFARIGRNGDQGPPVSIEQHIFEPQPSFKGHLERIVSAYSGPRLKIHYHAVAASVRDGEATFWLGNRNSEVASLNQRQRDWHMKRNITVKTIDFDRFLGGVAPRNRRRRPAVFFKLDIESGEFELLPHLLRQTDGSAAICAIDFWLIEWHLWRSTLTEGRSRFEVRRTIDQKIAAACPSRSVPAIVDHEERMSIHPPSPPTSPPPPPPPPQ